MFASRPALILLLAFTACKGSEAKEEPKLRSASVVPDLNARPPQPSDATPTSTKPVDKKKGDKSDDEWVPAEFKSGAARWKDAGVYVDGTPVGFLSWGELPLELKPIWIKDKVSSTKRPGSKDLGWRWGQQRWYRFNDYLAAMGIDRTKIKAMHVYGPRLSNSIVVTAADLAKPEAKDFLFRFGGNVGGKPIPHVPDNFGGGKVPDKMASVMIYIDKKPPTLTDDGFELDGVLQYGVPYRGEPIRGGVRIYLDGKYVTMIKRQELDPKKATQASNGELEWKLSDVLSTVDTSKVVEVWVIRDEKREEKLPGTELPNMTFQASAQAKGGILLGKDLLRAGAIALHTKPVTPEMLPVITQDDD